jgi:signal transduction histidine kinase
MAALPQHPPAGPRTVGARDAANPALFASLSRELRFGLDGDGLLTHVGGAWRRTLDREPSTVVGRHWTTVVAKADHAAMRAAIERALMRVELQPELELRMERADGEPRLVHWTLAITPGANAIVAVGYERTAQHCAAAELQREVEVLDAKVAELDEHSLAMERFAAMAAHQMSEPLIVAESGTIMVAEELGDALDSDLRARLDAIGRGAARARQTIDALLMDARSSNGMTLGPVSVERVVAQVVDDLRPRLEERGVVVEYGPLPAVRAEARLLAIVFQNLISNALKYGPRDGGVIALGAERPDDDWRLTVTSGGAPLAAGDGARIFEPFRRVPGERRAPGSGLGLAICARLVERLGGTIGFEPHREDGNVFYFTLPAA